MATTLETAHTVAAVLSVFHNAADLMKQIIKRSKKKRSEQALRLKWLLETLETGEVQISKKYTDYLKEMGDRFKVGDSMARDRLQHVAIIMQADLLRCLQLALDYENAELDVTKIQDDASYFRRDVLSALDELKVRLMQQAPAQAPQMYSQMIPTHYRDSGLGSGSNSPIPPSPGSIPPGINFHEPNDDDAHRVGRFFSISRKPARKTSASSSAIQNMVVSPSLNWLGPVESQQLKYELPAEDIPRQYESAAPYHQETKLAMPDPGDHLHPAYMQQPSISRNASTSTHSSGYSSYTRNSVFSDEKIAVVQENEVSAFPNMGDVSAALPNPNSLYPSPLHPANRQSQVSTSSMGSQMVSPTGTGYSNSPATSPTGLMPDPSYQSHWYPSHPVHDPAMNLPIPVVTPRDRSNTASSATTAASSIQPVVSTPYVARNTSVVKAPSITSSIPSSSSHKTAVLVGRPEKKNNYWGFCKGAWTIREDWRKGLATQVTQAGMFTQGLAWQCKSCSYQGPIFGAKKPFTIDPNIHEDKETAVRYRWIFLAKSHVKVKIIQREGEGGLGCLLCSLENQATAIYSTPTMLFRHIMDEHAPGMTDSLATRAKCIIGRRAAANEDFDLNIP